MQGGGLSIRGFDPVSEAKRVFSKQVTPAERWRADRSSADGQRQEDRPRQRELLRERPSAGRPWGAGLNGVLGHVSQSLQRAFGRTWLIEGVRSMS